MWRNHGTVLARPQAAFGATLIRRRSATGWIPSLTVVFVLTLAGSATAHGALAAVVCPPSMQCTDISTSNDLTFQCIVADVGGDTTARGDVLLLHGFPEWAGMYTPLMSSLRVEGYRSVACNLRGYSDGARPPAEEDYTYSILRDDIYALAKAANFSSQRGFHLVGHDHGAALGWFTASGASGDHERASQVLSYAALSVPHADVFNAALFGPTADLEQQIASQYFTMFTLPNSSSLHHDFFYGVMGKNNRDAVFGSAFASPSDFQRPMWWYNGAMNTGVMAMPPSMTAEDLDAHGAHDAANLRRMFGGAPAPGHSASVTIGNVSASTLFVCGTGDTYLLCNRPYALRTADHCSGGYRYLAVDCDHNVLSCANKTATESVVTAIIANIKSVTTLSRRGV